MVWIIGASGMLGTELRELFKKEGRSFCYSDQDVDILSPIALEGFYLKYKPQTIINCAAYTAVDLAEEQQELAYKINAEGVSNIASLAKKTESLLIHISTDYVFEGNASYPITETEPCNPVSIYGKSKREGEEAILSSGCRYYILRTAWLYGRYGKNFVSTMIFLMNSKDQVKVVQDQHGSPTWSYSLSKAILSMIENPQENGFYNFSSLGNISWYEFAQEIYRLGKEQGYITSDCNILPCSSEEYPSKAKRPRYSLLSKEKIQRQFGIIPPLWDQELTDFFLSIKGLKIWD